MKILMKSTENKKICKFRFDLKSFLIFLLIFVVEVIIALYANDRIIRPYGGDVLVVIMMYYFVKAFVRTQSLYIAASALVFAYLVEFGQYLNLVEVLHLQHNTAARIVIGSSFSWIDIIAYTIGGLVCYLIDRQTN